MRRVICPYCYAEAALTTLDNGRKVWRCPTPGCEAEVTAHKKSGAPMGTLANKELRYLRYLAHCAFDPIWKKGGRMSRSEAYKLLAMELEIPKKEAHIGKLNKEQCNKVIEQFGGCAL